MTTYEKWVLFVVGMLCCLTVSGTPYYISNSSGSDADTGLSTTHPQQHPPGSPLYTGSLTLGPGDALILKEGDTWGYTNFTWQVPFAGSVISQIYVGTNGSWGDGTDAVFEGNFTAHTLMYVGAAGAGATHHITFNGIKFHGVTNTADNQGLITVFQAHDITFTNCDLSGWTTSHIPDFYAGGLIWNNAASAYAITNMLLTHSIVHDEEFGASGQWSGEAIGFGGTIDHCVIHDVPTAILFAQALTYSTLYDIDFPYQNHDTGAHCNGFYMDNGNGNTLPANNLIITAANDTIYNSGNAANMLYPNVERYNCLIYNCLFYGNISAAQCIAIDTYNNGFTLIPPFFYPPNVSYDGSGNYTVTGLTAGNLYYWTKGASDTSCAGLTSTGFFTASGTSQVITGTPSVLVTAALAPAVMNSCYVYNNTIILTNLPTASSGIVPASRTGLLISNLWMTNNLCIGVSANLAPSHGSSTYILNAQVDNNVSLMPSAASAQGYNGSTLWVPTIPAFAYPGADLTSLGLAGLNWTNVGYASLAGGGGGVSGLSIVGGGQINIVGGGNLVISGK